MALPVPETVKVAPAVREDARRAAPDVQAVHGAAVEDVVDVTLHALHVRDATVALAAQTPATMCVKTVALQHAKALVSTPVPDNVLEGLQERQYKTLKGE